MFNSHAYKAPLATVLILLGSVGLLASEDKKKPSKSSKPAAVAAKPATSKTAATANRTTGGPNPSARPMGIHGSPAAVGSRSQQLKGGDAIQHRSDGRLSDVHDAKRGMDIHHGLNGERQVSVERADHSRIVAERGRAGYIQRPYSFHGHEFAQRSYYFQGHAYQSYYRGASFRGISINVYAPARYYPVGFYGWAYHPWGAPVAYAWGFGVNPWYGYYGNYFAPYPVYPNASLWLTDYMISSDLAAAYEAGKESGTLAPSDQAGNGSPALTPEVKQMIADEVRNQIALENSDAQQTSQNQDPDPASSGIARMLGDGHPHIFVTGRPLDVVDDSGAECALSDGDALQLKTPPPPDAQSVSLVVLSSKGRRECPKFDSVTVGLADLQEMQNHMRESIDRGMAELRDKQGKGGLPVAPPSAAAAPTATGFAQIAPPPDPNDAAAIDQQLTVADQSEKDVTVVAKQEDGTSKPDAPPAVSR
jgi:hypothetical protein